MLNKNRISFLLIILPPLFSKLPVDQITVPGSKGHIKKDQIANHKLFKKYNN